MLLWTWIYKYLFKYLVSTLLCIYSKVELLSHVVILFYLGGTAILFYSVYIISYSHQKYTSVPISPYSHQHLFSGLSVFLNNSHPRAVTSYLIVICPNVNFPNTYWYQISCTYWLFVYPLWRNIYLRPLSIF